MIRISKMAMKHETLESDDHVVEFVEVQQESQHIVYETQCAKSQAKLKDLKDVRYTNVEIEEALSVEEEEGIEEIRPLVHDKDEKVREDRENQIL
ncbi:hypothetical protein L1887_09989 [Cichorium endivia]|nr:hypothetical protein L1887_09989 [Cichorium endivia]